MMVPVLLALCIALTDALTAFPPKCECKGSRGGFRGGHPVQGGMGSG